MAVTRFAAIDIGSYYVSMELFEISRKNGLKSINHLRQRLELGKDTYNHKKLSREKIDRLCHILNDFKMVMEEYQIKEYRACAKSAFREAKNMVLMADQVYQHTGIQIDVLSNSEQRFLGYKAIASKENDFQRMIEKGTAIIDMGGGSVQVSLFDKDALVSTQNIPVGSMRTREQLSVLERETTKPERLVEEIVRKDIQAFKRLYLKDRKITNVILVGDYFTNLIFHNKAKGSMLITRETFMKWYHEILGKSDMSLAMEMHVPMEFASVILPTAVIYRKLIDELGAETIWLPGIQLTDGMAYDYGEKHQIIRADHDFENDIIMATKNMAKRYTSSQKHTNHLVFLADAIFDGVKKISHLTERDRLLLKIAVMLHDCGKYISMSNVSENSYNIIMSTEIIGLSHAERELIAYVVRYHSREFEYYGESSMRGMLTREEYMKVAKLCSILGIVNALDRSHMQKILQIKAHVREGRLFIRAEHHGDFAVEAEAFNRKTGFFEEIFNIQPVLKLKKQI